MPYPTLWDLLTQRGAQGGLQAPGTVWRPPNAQVSSAAVQPATGAFRARMAAGPLMNQPFVSPEMTAAQLGENAATAGVRARLGASSAAAAARATAPVSQALGPEMAPAMVRQRIAPAMSAFRSRMAPVAEAAEAVATKVPLLGAIGATAKRLAWPVAAALGTAEAVRESRDPNSPIAQAGDALRAETLPLFQSGQYARGTGTAIRKGAALANEVLNTASGARPLMAAGSAALRGAGQFIVGLTGAQSDVDAPAVAAAPKTVTGRPAPGSRPWPEMAAKAAADLSPNTVLDPLAEAAKEYPGLSFRQLIQAAGQVPNVARSAAKPASGANLLINRYVAFLDKEFQDIQANPTIPAAEKVQLQKENRMKLLLAVKPEALTTMEQLEFADRE